MTGSVTAMGCCWSSEGSDDYYQLTPGSDQTSRYRAPSTGMMIVEPTPIRYLKREPPPEYLNNPDWKRPPPLQIPITDRRGMIRAFRLHEKSRKK